MFKKIDSFFFFPFAYLAFGVIGLFSTRFDIVKVLLFLSVFAFFHFLYLLYDPYINTSNYYKYLSMRQNFIQTNKCVEDFLSPKQKVIVQYSLLGSTVFLMQNPACYELVVLVQGVSFSLFFIQNVIEIVNIVKTPKLPESIKIFHPFYMQKRHFPQWMPLLEKLGTTIMPACGRILKISVGGLGFSMGAYKYVNGLNAIDPVQTRIRNLYHGLPQDTKWDEARYVGFVKFKNTYQMLHPGSSTMDAYQSFSSKEERILKVIHHIIFDPSDS